MSNSGTTQHHRDERHTNHRPRSRPVHKHNAATDRSPFRKCRTNGVRTFPEHGEKCRNRATRFAQAVRTDPTDTSKPCQPQTEAYRAGHPVQGSPSRTGSQTALRGQHAGSNRRIDPLSRPGLPAPLRRRTHQLSDRAALRRCCLIGRCFANSRLVPAPQAPGLRPDPAGHGCRRVLPDRPGRNEIPPTDSQ